MRYQVSDRVAKIIRESKGYSHKEFERWLGEQGIRLGFTWRRGRGRGRVYELSDRVNGLLYVLISPSRYWGPYVGVIRRMKATGLPWLVVLLLGSVDAGYVFTRPDVDGHVERGSWSPNAHGAFQVRVSKPETLTPGSEFRNQAELVKQLASRLGGQR